MRHARIALLVVGIVLLAQVAPLVSEAAPPAATVPVCNGKYKDGLKPSPTELTDILKKHARWLMDSGPLTLELTPEVANDPRRANLCGANLTDANLTNAQLEGADLTGADLGDADLAGANLTDANLTGADLSVTDLTGAELGGADLTGASLADANLTDADLTDTNVSKASLDSVDLTGATYAPSSEPPDLSYIVGIRGLTAVNANRGEQIGLIKLRKLLQDADRRHLANRGLSNCQMLWTDRA
jgi:Pentapeptide repeats (8 copies)